MRRLALVCALVAAGCGGTDSERREGEFAGSEIAGSCIAAVEFRDRPYVGTAARVPARLGDALGVAKRPPCGDSTAGTVPVAEIDGVEPAVAIGVPGDPPLSIYVAESRPQSLPELELLLEGPPCAAAEPFAVAGRVVGESNLDQPYTVQLEVDSADEAGVRYLGLVVDVHVHDTTRGLRERGSAPVGSRVRADVRCQDGELVARSLERAEPLDVRWDGRLCAAADAEPPCGPGVEHGRWYAFDLLTHCGIEHARLDGRTWLADPPLDDGSGNPPPGVANPVQPGFMRLLSPELAEFKVVGGINVRFRPAPARYEPPGCA